MVSLHNTSECSHVVTSGSGATQSIVAAAAGTKVRLYRLILTTAGAASVTLQDTGSNALSQTFTFGANGGSITLDTPNNGDPWWGSGLGLGLQWAVTGGVVVNADVWYLQGP